MKHKIRHIHFVGIGGTGMSGIAEVLFNLGYVITGSDQHDSATVARLRKLGITIAIGHNAGHIAGAHAVVVSSAIDENNPEIKAAREAYIPVVPRALMLAELMRLRKGIAIAGTHGKTTTTSLVASVLEAGQMEPTFVIGGRLNAAGSNARLGAGEFIVVEADESDASFLYLQPIIAVITNIDLDHMATYGGDVERLKQAFIDFTRHIPFYGVAIVCIDDANARAILPAITPPVVRYGFASDADVRAINPRIHQGLMEFEVEQKGYPLLSLRLNQPGIHNIQNACAAIAIGRELEIGDDAIAAALLNFAGVGRRFTRHGLCALPEAPEKTFDLVDDYGHHPVELEKTIAAARLVFPGRRLVLVFQPHRYSRTRDLFDDFVRVLGSVDVLLLCEVYAAGEMPLAGADSHELARALRAARRVDPVYVAQVGQVRETLTPILEKDDVVMSMGAGSISQLPDLLTRKL